MRALARLLVAPMLLLFLACEGPPDTPGTPGTPDSPDAGTPDGGSSLTPIVDLRADVNRNGTVDLADPTEDEGEETWSTERGAIFLANIDDDESACPYSGDVWEISDGVLAGCHDAADEKVNGEADLEDLARLRTVPWPDAPADAVGTLTVPGVAASQVRLFVKRESGFQLFDPATGRVGAEELRRGVEWAIEAKDIVRDLLVWDGYASVVFSVTWSGGPAEPLSDTVRLRVSPVMTFHHGSPARTLYVANLLGTAEQREQSSRFQAELEVARASAQVPSVYRYDTYVSDRWMQDYFEPAYMAMPAPGGGQHVIRVNYRAPFIWSSTRTESPLRDAGRIAFQLRGPDSAAVQQYDLGLLSSGGGSWQTLNSTGNTETIPPYEKDGVRYPLGRLLLGSTETARMDPTYTRMLEAQGMQPPVYVDTSWLYVGHVDETLSFLPVDSPRGWVALVADPVLARRMLEDAQARGHGDAKLFSGQLWGKDKQFAPAEVSVSEVLANADVLGASAEAAPHLDAQLAVLRAETGLTDAEVIRVPFLFQWDHGRLAAYQPGTVNLLSLSRTVVAAPDPHGPVIDGRDLFKSQLEGALAPYGVSVHWLDDWMLYHRYNGNVHCATNVAREVPQVKWWETGR